MEGVRIPGKGAYASRQGLSMKMISHFLYLFFSFNIDAAFKTD
jgi:hypothetical protein